MTDVIGNTRVVGRQDKLVAPVEYTSTSIGSTTPTVLNIATLVFQNVAPITVTNFLKGYNNQLLRILGDGQTTIQNNALVKTNTGVNKLLATNKVYTFSLINSVWYENE